MVRCRTCVAPNASLPYAQNPALAFPVTPLGLCWVLRARQNPAPPASPLDFGFPRLVSVRLARKNAKDTKGIFLASRTLTSPPKLVWRLAVAVSRWA